MRGRLVDEYLLFVAPAFLGAGGVPAVGGDGWRLGAEPRVRIADVRRLGTDVVIRAEPAGG
jgi:riboflavin biosynthesis pyrimidine reductase